jgi:S1-C subfamily serine protease
MKGYVARSDGFTSFSPGNCTPRALKKSRAFGLPAVVCVFLLVTSSLYFVTGTALAGNTLSSLEDELAQIVENVKTSIVTVSCQYDVRRASAFLWPLDAFQSRTSQSASSKRMVGSGIVYTEEIVVTSGSVVRSSEAVTVAFEDGRSYEAQVLGFDRNANVCVLRVTGLRARPIPIGNSKSIRVGSLVVLMGNSFGKLPTVALGTVSGRQKVARTHGKWEVIQLSGPVHPGNSGGAVLNTRGELVAMVMGRLVGEMKPGFLGRRTEVDQQIEAVSPASGSVGLALPAEEVRTIVEELLKNGYVPEGYLGVSVQTYRGGADITRIGLASAPGIEISEVISGGPAHRAGLRSGDVLSEFDDEPVLAASQLAQMVSSTRPGDKVRISYWRGAKRMSTVVVLGASKPSQSTIVPSRSPNPPQSSPNPDRILSTEN